MEEINQFLQYGSLGALAYVVVKWVLPNLKASSNRADVDGEIYRRSKDSIEYAYEQLERQRKRYEKLREDYDTLAREMILIKQELRDEKEKRACIERKLNKLIGEQNA